MFLLLLFSDFIIIALFLADVFFNYNFVVLLLLYYYCFIRVQCFRSYCFVTLLLLFYAWLILLLSFCVSIVIALFMVDVFYCYVLSFIYVMFYCCCALIISAVIISGRCFCCYYFVLLSLLLLYSWLMFYDDRINRTWTWGVINL